MFLESFRITILAVTQIFLLGAVGYFLVRRNILGPECLNAISRLVVEVTLPLLIFSQLIRDFSFSLYPDWWIFPLISLGVTVLGLITGFLFSGFIRGQQHKSQFSSLVTFQNSGYLPLALVAALLPKEQADTMFIFLFLFLLGFNLLVWSVGVYMLSSQMNRKFELGSLFSPPVVAALFSLIFIFLGLNRFIPEFVIKPLKMTGDCTLPLAMFVVGGNLAQIRLGSINKKAICLLVLAKLFIMPILGILLLMKLRLPELVGLLIIMQLAMPPATSLSVITRHYKKEDLLISQGVFFGHVISLLTIPIFLSLYYTLIALK